MYSQIIFKTIHRVDMTLGVQVDDIIKKSKGQLLSGGHSRACPQDMSHGYGQQL